MSDVRTIELIPDGAAIIARTKEASPASVGRVVTADINDDGRSAWLWVRLQNGDLMLACFPCGALYESLESEASF